jgi:uncharacterized protein YigE (DUF2233 family)
MNKNILKTYFVKITFAACMLGACIMGRAQGVSEPFVKTAKTRTGSVTYVVMGRNGYDMDIFSKEAGEPYDFASVVQQCTGAKRQVVFAMNGAKCDKNLKPLGLLIKGLVEHKKFVWPDANVFSPVGPSAVFATERDKDVSYIIAADNFKAANALANYRLAIQSGTILISRNFLNKNIIRASGRQVYNGMGMRANGDMVFAVTNDKMDMREFALFFQEQDCRDAMLLDEGANCQWYAPGKEKKPGKMGEIIVVTKK